MQKMFFFWVWWDWWGGGWVVEDAEVDVEGV